MMREKQFTPSAFAIATAVAALPLALAGSSVNPTGHEISVGPAVRHADETPLCAATPGPSATAAFYAAMRRADASMHAAMMVVPTGDVDRDFARMMIPHHQGALAMAQDELLYGHDQRLKRLAQAMIVEQGQEITYLNLLLTSSQTVSSGDALRPY